MNLLISGYIIGSPTRDKAQCCGFIPSANLSGRTPGTPCRYYKKFMEVVVRFLTSGNFSIQILVQISTKANQFNSLLPLNSLMSLT